MMTDRRGLSTVVTTLIVILLVLVAIAVIWVVVRGVIQGGASKSEILARCNQIDVRPTAASCEMSSGDYECDVTIERKPGTDSDSIDGVKIVFTNTGTGTTSSVLDSETDGSPTLTDLEVLASEKIDFTGLGTSDLGYDKVEVNVYIKDDAGEKQICELQGEFNFA